MKFEFQKLFILWNENAMYNHLKPDLITKIKCKVVLNYWIQQKNNYPWEFRSCCQSAWTKNLHNQEQESLEHKINVLDDQNTKLKTFRYTKSWKWAWTKSNFLIESGRSFYHLYSTINSNGWMRQYLNWEYISNWRTNGKSWVVKPE